MPCKVFVKGFFPAKSIEESVNCYESIRKINIAKEVTLNTETNTIYLKTECAYLSSIEKEKPLSVATSCDGLVVVFEVKCWMKNTGVLSGKITETENILIVFKPVRENTAKGIVINKRKMVKHLLSKLKENPAHAFNLSRVYHTFEIGYLKSVCEEIESVLRNLDTALR